MTARRVAVWRPAAVQLNLFDLDKASGAHGAPAAEAFRQADSIRQKMGLAWEDLIEQRGAA